MKEESLLLLSDLQKLINQVVLIDYTIIILEGEKWSTLKLTKRYFCKCFNMRILKPLPKYVNDLKKLTILRLKKYGIRELK